MKLTPGIDFSPTSGEAHPDVRFSLTNLGLLLHERVDLRGAERHYLEGLVALE